MKLVLRLSVNMSASPVRDRMLELCHDMALQRFSRSSHPLVLYEISISSIRVSMGGIRRNKCWSVSGCWLAFGEEVWYCETTNFRTSRHHGAFFHGFVSVSRKSLVDSLVAGGCATKFFRPDGVRFGLTVLAKNGLMISVRSMDSQCSRRRLIAYWNCSTVDIAFPRICDLVGLLLALAIARSRSSNLSASSIKQYMILY